jgi:hypothetical protein
MLIDLRCSGGRIVVAKNFGTGSKREAHSSFFQVRSGSRWRCHPAMVDGARIRDGEDTPRPARPLRSRGLNRMWGIDELLRHSILVDADHPKGATFMSVELRIVCMCMFREGIRKLQDPVSYCKRSGSFTSLSIYASLPSSTTRPLET